ncbi:MAG: DUF58 domain-containing protein [Acidimicrobiia bacterium]
MTTAGLTQASPAEVLRRLQLKVFRRLDGLLQGDYQGLIPGHGSEPGETRLYEPGDDVRRIDWNVTARAREVHLRQPIADRELELSMVVDMSASLDFGTAITTKRELAISAASAIALLASRGGNRIGATVVSGAAMRTYPPRPGREALLALLHQLVTADVGDGQGPADLATALERVAKAARRRGMVVLVTDFLDESAWDRPLRALSHRHDVLAVEIVDPRELELPDVGVISLIDPETGRHRTVSTANAKLRARYAEAAARQRNEIRERLRRSGAAHLQLRTDRDWLVDFARFVSSRKRLVGVGG